MPDKYFDVDGIATLVHHRGATTLPGAPPNLGVGQPILLLHDAGVNGNVFGDLMDLLVLSNSPFSFDLPCLLYTSPSPRDGLLSRMPSSA